MTKAKKTEDAADIAEAIGDVGNAIGSLLYGLKYSQQDGLSIAEAIEVGLKAIASAVEGGLQSIATAIEYHADEPTKKS